MSDTEETLEEQPQKSGSTMTRIIIGAVVVVVILAEGVLAYIFIPSAKQVSNEVLTTLEPEKQGDASTVGEKSELEDTDLEVELGDFTIMLHQPTAGTSMQIHFLLAGTVKSEDKEEFDKLLENNKHRFRDKVLSEVRESEVTDLTQPGLGLIKRRILAKSNALFGKPLLTSIVFSKFTFHER